MSKMNQIPNIITAFRLLCSFILLFLKPFSSPFFLIYLIGGLSDIIDGFLARKLCITSKLGAMLDSIADAFFILVLLIIFIPHFDWPIWITYWVIAIIIIRLLSLVVGFFKYHTFDFLHTYANKATGLALFSFPFLYFFWGLDFMAIFLCIFASISAIEELLINMVSEKLDRNVTSIFASLKAK
ncbi:CDP-alcohol phosphatidyltransferase family protein [Anaerovorax odorimutans]|uniref:CDP-alcohol phosphatidyltransferase family protein n=1 Tax=Anaerovorax odorimutans TaxID=109327 RepID=UPI00040D723E|nr:CDP-alcohol phosphatidyltransferase family protein [Anaerovorax odorimutans]